MQKIFFAVLMIGVITMACNSAPEEAHHKDGFSETPKTKEDSLFRDVIEGHDVAMAKMGALKKYSNQVYTILDSLDKRASKKADTSYQQHLRGLQTQLNEAQQAMNNWMDTFAPDSLENDKTLRIQYLEWEKERVGTVRNQILATLQRADSLLKK